jgi:hypothetical protein
MTKGGVASPLRTVYSAAALGFGVWFFVTGMIAFFGWPWYNAQRWDCGVDWGAAKLFFERISPYSDAGLSSLGLEGYGFGHPPTTPFWFLPLADMAWPQAAQLIGMTSIASLALIVGICCAHFRIWAPVATNLLVLGLLLRTTWMYDHLLIVQISSTIACLMVLGWHYLRDNRDVRAGLCLGAACTLKLFPAVVVIYCLLLRRWRAAFASVAIYLPIAGIMTSRYGWGCWRAFFKQQGPIAHFWMDYPRNASLHGIILRIFRPPCERPYVNGFLGVREFASMKSMPPMKGQTLAVIASLLLLAICSYLVLRAPKTRAALDVGMAMFMVLATFINPWIWEHYNVVLVMPMFAALVFVWRGWSDRLVAWMTGKFELKRFVVVTAGALAALALLGFVIWTFQIDMYFKETLYGSVWEKKNANLPVPAFLHFKLHLYEFFNWAPWPIVLLILMVVLGSMGRETLGWFRRKVEATDGAVLKPAAG